MSHWPKIPHRYEWKWKKNWLQFFVCLLVKLAQNYLIGSPHKVGLHWIHLNFGLALAKVLHVVSYVLIWAEWFRRLWLASWPLHRDNMTRTYYFGWRLLKLLMNLETKKKKFKYCEKTPEISKIWDNFSNFCGLLKISV